MAHLTPKQIEKWLSQYLTDDEHLVSFAVFKKVPSVGWLLLTKGMAWVFSQKLYVGVTNQRLIILPASRKRKRSGMQEDAIYAGLNEVEFYVDGLNTTILNIQKTYEGEPLKLRFKSDNQVQGMDQFDFIAAVKERKEAHTGA
jgi:hypothetical protein